MKHSQLAGVKLIEQGDSVLAAQKRRKHGFEPHTIALWKMLSQRGKVMVDVGCYTGFYAILASLNGASRVNAYEPNLAILARISDNLDLNKVSNVEVHTVALWDCDGEAELHGKSALTSASSLVSDKPVMAKVKTVRLDAEALGRIYAMKIDVERAEPQVLTGALETLKECKPHVLIEALDGTEAIDDILCPIGYKGRKLDGGMYYYRAKSNG